jgi:hypothetical protein
MKSVRSRATDCFGLAVESAGLPAVAVDLEAEFRGDHHTVTNGCESFADDVLVGEWAVHLRGIEECDSTIDCRSDQPYAITASRGRAVSLAEPHASQPDCRDGHSTLT